MKKLLIAMVLLLCVAIAGCGDGQTPQSGNSTGSTKPSVNNSQSTGAGDITTDATDSSDKTDESTDISTGESDTTDESTDVSTEDSGTTDGGVDSSVDSSTDTSDSTDVSTDTSDSTDETDTSTDTSDSTQPGGGDDVEPEPEPEPEIPDGPIDIAKGRVTDYVIVYDEDNVRVTEFAQRFADYMSSAYRITFELIGDGQKNENKHCIYIGDVKGAQRVKARLNSENDFGACISGDDYVLYATNDRLYEYLFEVLKKEVLVYIRSGNWSLTLRDNRIYHTSKYKDTSYVDYVISQNGGSLTQEVLLKFFEARTFVATDGTELAYRIYVPYDYDKTKEYPVLTFLHGANERGNNNTSQMTHMLRNLFLMEDSQFWDCIVVCPQCPWGNQWVDTPWEKGDYRVENVPESNELIAVMEILDLVEETFPTDVDRYYAMGLSMGGFGTWDLIMRHADRFAAAVPICGGADETQASVLVNKPIYTVHGTGDMSVPISGTQKIVSAILALRGDKIEYEYLKGYDHNVWGYASEKPEIWEWLFRQTMENQ